jgi:hypothetical protein
MSRLLWPLAATVAAWTAPSAAPSIARAATVSRALPNGIEVWTSTLAGAETVTVRLEIGMGLVHELPDRLGLLAAVGAALERGTVGPFPAGELAALEREAGLETEVVLEYDNLALVTSGPPQALARALWLAGQRLLGPSDRPEDMVVVREGVWSGAEYQRLEALGPEGDAFDALAASLLGSRWGHTGYRSRSAASMLDDAALAERVRFGARTGGARLIVVCPPERLSGLDALVDQILGPLPPRRSLPMPERPGRPREIDERLLERQNPVDRRHLVALGWDLRGAGARAGFDRVTEDATLLTLVELLRHPGGVLQDVLAGTRPEVRAFQVRLQLDDVGALLVLARSPNPDLAGTSVMITREIAELSQGNVSPQLTRAAAQSAVVELETAWGHPEGRAEIIGTLVRSGRVPLHASPEDWLLRLSRELGRVQPSTLQRFGVLALSPATQMEARFVAEASGDPEITIDGEVLSMYLRLMVDIRCPPGEGRRMALAEILKTKYRLDARSYVELSRAISKRGDALRELSHEADQRCQEYAKLRGLLAYDRVLELHRMLACGPGRQPLEEKRERAVRRIFERFDMDPSVYWPLVRMWREDPEAALALRGVDLECGPRFGPAAEP